MASNMQVVSAGFLRCSVPFLQTALCVQNIRYVLFKKTEIDEELSERRRLVSCVCSNVAADVLCKGTWDREVSFSVISLHHFRITHNTIKIFSHFD